MSYYDINELNALINYYYSKEIEDELSYESLKNNYIKSNSLNKKIEEFIILFKECDIDYDKRFSLIDKMIQRELIVSPGLKSITRGIKFNKIVKEEIENKFKKYSNLVIRFEEKSKKIYTEEIPDWTIYDTKNNKILIGMNQLDLWTGGHQTNRGSKYIIERQNDINNKLLCVICSHIKIKSKKNKAFNLFNIGFRNETLCYISQLEYIIKKYFEL